VQELLILDRPDQLKALGHPLRLRTLELLCQDDGRGLTNRELAQRLTVDPGHLHFHVRMLQKAGLIELATGEGRGREKPYRAIARELRVHPDLLATNAAAGAHAALLDDVQQSMSEHAESGRFRTLQAVVRLPLERAVELMDQSLDTLLGEETADDDNVVVTVFVGPPSPDADPRK
jgi:DNA-binding transcriptional ArsR family regulator